MDEKLLLLEASAGSGKTYALTNRFLRSLWKVLPEDPYRDSAKANAALSTLLAVTFTNKAAEEMSDRILKTLKELALQGDDSAFAARLREVLGSQGPVDVVRERKKALGIVELILSRMGDFRVTTIDSLMTSFVQSLSPELGLTPGFKISLDSQGTFQTTYRSFFAAQCEDRWTEVESFLLQALFLGKLTGWSPEKSTRELIGWFFGFSLQQGDLKEPEDSPETVQRAIDEEWIGFRERMVPLFRRMEDLNGQGYLKKNDSLIDFLRKLVGTSSSVRDTTVLLKKAFFKYSSKEDALKVLKVSTPDDRKEEFWNLYRPAQESLILLLDKLSLQKALLFLRMAKRFEAFWEEGRRDLYVAELSLVLAKRVQSWQEQAFPYLYLKLAEKYRFFHFDEFQDTSLRQFQALSPMVDERLSSDERAELFFVGDKKQAIYRWRGGRAELMEREELEANLPALRNREGGEGSLQTKTLGKNWRSGERIVEFNNSFWGLDRTGWAAFLNSPGSAAALEKNFQGVQQETGREQQRGKGYVFIETKTEVKGERNQAGEEEDENGGSDSRCGYLGGRVLEGIREARGRGYRYRDMAILVRKKDQGEGVMRVLNEAGIPVVSEESMMLSSTPLIRELVTLLRFLDHPLDDLSLLAFLSGNLFGRLPGVTPETPRTPEELVPLREEDKGEPLYKTFQRVCPELWREYLEPLFRSVGFLSPYDLFQDFCERFRLLEGHAEETPFLLSFGDLLQKYEEAGITSLGAFFERWKSQEEEEGKEGRVVLPEGFDSIRLMTVHKAKGLEFPVVFLPLWPEKTRRGENLHFDEKEALCRSFSSDAAEISPTLGRVKRRETVLEYIDELNLLYVAFTRPRDVLWVTVLAKAPPKKEPEEDSPFSDYPTLLRRHPLLGRAFLEENLFRYALGEWPERPGEPEQRARSGEDETRGFSSKNLSTYRWHKDLLVYRPGRWQGREERVVTERGNRLHKVLEGVETFRGREDLTRLLEKECWRLGLEREEKARLEEFLLREDVSRYFSPGWEVFREREVVLKRKDQESYLRIDRLLCGEREFVVVDYKTGEHHPENVQQVKEYLEALEPLLPGKPGRGVLLYLDRGEVVEVER